MKTPFLFSLFISLLLLVAGCQKKPSASFSTNKDTYQVGENVMCSDMSTDAYTAVWVVKGPSEFRSDNKNSFTFIPQLAGNYEITRACYSKNNKYISKKSKNIVVNPSPVVTPTTSQYTFYCSNIYNSYVGIYVDGSYQGAITQQYFSSPSCGASGCVTVTLTSGSHSVQAYFSAFSGNEYYTINASQSGCNTFLVSY